MSKPIIKYENIRYIKIDNVTVEDKYGNLRFLRDNKVGVYLPYQNIKNVVIIYPELIDVSESCYIPSINDEIKIKNKKYTLKEENANTYGGVLKYFYWEDENENKYEFKSEYYKIDSIGNLISKKAGPKCEEQKRLETINTINKQMSHHSYNIQNIILYLKRENIKPSEILEIEKLKNYLNLLE
jgi:hypothetical protein